MVISTLDFFFFFFLFFFSGEEGGRSGDGGGGAYSEYRTRHWSSYRTYMCC